VQREQAVVRYGIFVCIKPRRACAYHAGRAAFFMRHVPFSAFAASVCKGFSRHILRVLIYVKKWHFHSKK